VGEWSAARPGRNLAPGKTRYSFYSRLGGPQGRSGRAENIVPTGIRSRTVQPVVTIVTELPDPKFRYTERETELENVRRNRGGGGGLEDLCLQKRGKKEKPTPPKV